MTDQRNQEQDQENDKEYFRNAGKSDGNARKSQHSRK
jgi:hypothetical protein